MDAILAGIGIFLVILLISLLFRSFGNLLMKVYRRITKKDDKLTEQEE